MSRQISSLMTNIDPSKLDVDKGPTSPKAPLPDRSGVLLELARPNPSMTTEDFHSWYAGHGASRMKLPWIRSGSRYQSVESGGGTSRWLALYDVDDVSNMEPRQRGRLRAVRSECERGAVAQIEIDGRVCKLVSVHGTPQTSAPVLLLIRLWLAEQDVGEARQWMEEVSTCSRHLRTRGNRLI